MTTDECARIEELISAIQDDAATPEEVARVERHTAGCARCRATAAAYQRVDQQVRRYIMATPVPEIAAPWRAEPLIIPARRGGGGLGHWRITLVGLATVFVFLLAGTLLTLRSLDNRGQIVRESDPTAVAQYSASDIPATPTTAPAAGLPTAAAAMAPAPAAPAGGGAAPAAGNAAATATSAPAAPRAASSAAPAASAAPAPAAAASAAPSRAPAASSAPAAAPPAATPAPTRAAASAAPGAGSTAGTPTTDSSTFNPAQAYRLGSATSLTICRPECDPQPQSAEVLQRVAAALNQPLAPAFVPPSTVPIPYVTLRFRLADGQQIDIGYYLQVNILQMPDGKGTFAAPADLVAALAGAVAPR